MIALIHSQLCVCAHAHAHSTVSVDIHKIQQLCWLLLMRTLNTAEVLFLGIKLKSDLLGIHALF